VAASRAPRAWARRSFRGLIAAAALLVLQGAVVASADTLFADGFESGDFSAWSQVTTAGDGSALVQGSVVRSGAYAAQLSESATAGSKAYARKTLASPEQELSASADFQVVQQGASGGNVPFFRLLDSASARIVSVYRQNGTSGVVGLGYGGSNFSTSGRLALGTWASVSVHVIVAGAGASTVEVALNGTLVYQTTSASLTGSGVATVQIGNDTGAQAFNLVADNVALQNASGGTPTPPANTSPPTISGAAQQGQTLTASPGSWSGTQPISYGYEWRRCDSAGGSCAAIAGATASSYTLTGADVGSTLRVAVTGSNSAGSATAVSAATAVVQAAAVPPANTSPPTNSGAAQQGQTLTASPGSWSGTQPISYGYEWRRCDSAGGSCAAIAGATASSYTLTSADVGSTLRVAVTGSNSAGSATAVSAPTAVVQASQSGGLVALWHMDETSGTTMLDSVGSNNGTLQSVQLGVPGFAGTGYGFNGSSSYVSVPSADSLNPGSANFSFTMHLKTTSVPAAPDWDLMRKGLYTTPGGEYKMEWQPSGQASCGFKGSLGYSELMAGPWIADGQWHTITCAKTSSDIRLIVDGQTFTRAGAVGSISNTSAVVIGARPGSEFFLGTLDEASLTVG
jgi:hypothetical protein